MTKTTETDVTSTPAEKKAKLFDLSIPQLMAGALTAMTMATVGSRLGVMGTVAGAALGSVVATIISTVYTAGVHKTTETVQRIVRKRADGRTETVEVLRTTEPTSSSSPAVTRPGARQPTRPSRRYLWGTAGAVMAGAAATFAITLALVTGAELTTGSSLDGKDGTTLSQVAPKTSSSPSAKPSTSPSATPSASATPTVVATPTPTKTITVTSTPTPTASTAPVTTPTAQPSTGTGSASD